MKAGPIANGVCKAEDSILVAPGAQPLILESDADAAANPAIELASHYLQADSVSQSDQRLVFCVPG